MLGAAYDPNIRFFSRSSDHVVTDGMAGFITASGEARVSPLAVSSFPLPGGSPSPTPKKSKSKSKSRSAASVFDVSMRPFRTLFKQLKPAAYSSSSARLAQSFSMSVRTPRSSRLRSPSCSPSQRRASISTGHTLHLRSVGANRSPRYGRHRRAQLSISDAAFFRPTRQAENGYDDEEDISMDTDADVDADNRGYASEGDSNKDPFATPSLRRVAFVDMQNSSPVSASPVSVRRRNTEKKLVQVLGVEAANAACSASLRLPKHKLGDRYE
ncbi:hypothetical protein C8R43DRAFT_586716 [Mycena crocata]|nr:hypothetical protein C8R43DRAFT_586716 [Mycena crocata]